MAQLSESKVHFLLQFYTRLLERPFLLDICSAFHKLPVCESGFGYNLPHFAHIAFRIRRHTALAAGSALTAGAAAAPFSARKCDSFDCADLLQIFDLTTDVIGRGVQLCREHFNGTGVPIL